jgi:hypothetical protein
MSNAPDTDDEWPDDFEAVFTEEDARECYEEEMAFRDAMVRENIHRARLQRFAHESNYTLTEWEKSFYIIKLYICYWLGWGWQKHHGEYPDDLCAVLVHHTKTYAGWEEHAITVGYGIFRNWFYDLKRDSEWNM